MTSSESPPESEVLANGRGVRMPATTSSPCAFGSHSPKKRFSPVLGLSDETFAKAMTTQMRLMRRTKRP